MKNRKLTKSTKIKKKIPNNLQKTTYMILPTNSIVATIKKECKSLGFTKYTKINKYIKIHFQILSRSRILLNLKINTYMQTWCHLMRT